MLDASIGLVSLLLAAVSLVAARFWFSSQPGSSRSADLGAMVAATACTGLLALGLAEMTVFVIEASGIWAWVDGAVAIVGVVAITAVSFYVANHMRTRGAIPAA